MNKLLFESFKALKGFTFILWVLSHYPAAPFKLFLGAQGNGSSPLKDNQDILRNCIYFFVGNFARVFCRLGLL